MLTQLTEQEKEVEDCLVNGMSDNELSKKLGISTLSIEELRKSIKKNLMDKIPLNLLASWQEDNERFFDFGWVYHFAF